MRQLFYWVVTLLVLFALVTISGCSDNDHSSNTSSSTETLILGTLSSSAGVTTFRQTVTMEDSDSYEYFPGQPNTWDIDDDFSLDDGGDDQFDGVMDLSVGGESFSGQSYSDLSFYTPSFNSTNGVKVAAVVEEVMQNYNNNGPVPAINGDYSAYLNDVYDGRLSQTVDLSWATSPLSLIWSLNFYIDGGDFDMDAPYIRVVIRDPVDGAILESVETYIGNGSGTYNVTLDNSYIGETIVVSFEISSSGYGPNLIDDVSLTDGAAVEYIDNGDFETGDLTGWDVNDPDELQNFTSAGEDIAGLTVTRSFYTVPDKLWGRWVDTFTNNTSEAITTTIDYDANLGSDSAGILYLTPGTDGYSLTGWDGYAQEDPPDASSSGNDRDFAFVFGNVDTVDFVTATALDNGNGDGSDNITHSYSITVNPGEMLAIVNFVVMNGVDTGESATDVTARATAIDAEALDIVNNFWDDVQYRNGMTQEQIDAIINF